MITLQFDTAYFSWAKLFCRSLALFEPHHRLVADTVNLSRREVRELESAYPGIEVLERRFDSSPARMARRKPFVMQRVMDAWPKEPWYCMLDVDFLVRRPLADLWSHVDDHAAALIITNGHWNGTYYPHLVTISSIVIVRPDGRELIDSWAEWTRHDQPIGNIKPGRWFWDQVVLLEAVYRTGMQCRRISINRFADSGLRHDSAIWSANVRAKRDYYRRFRRELERLAAGAS